MAGNLPSLSGRYVLNLFLGWGSDIVVGVSSFSLSLSYSSSPRERFFPEVCCAFIVRGWMLFMHRGTMEWWVRVARLVLALGSS